MCDNDQTFRRFSSLPQREDCGDNADFIRKSVAQLDRGRSKKDPTAKAEMADLQYRLFQAGRHDVALGRLFEGHVDAWQILHRYGAEDQLKEIEESHGANALLGVWNAEGDGYSLEHRENRLSGGKSYASGAGILSHALVTSDAGTPNAQLHLVDLESDPGDIDDTWWQVTGMRHSETHRVQWKGAKGWPVGQPGDYEREPWFSGGALRFATVQVGGLAGLLNAVRVHLVKMNRAGDAIQQRRLAALHGEASAAAALVLSIGRAMVSEGERFETVKVANARNVVYASCERGIALAQQAVGTAAYFEGIPACRFAQDLSMYIRQPGPDAQLAKVGAAVAEGSLEVWPCGS